MKSFRIKKLWPLVIFFIPALNLILATANYIIEGVEIEKTITVGVLTFFSIIPLYFPIKYIYQNTLLIDKKNIYINELWLLRKYKKFDINDLQFGTNDKLVKVSDEKKSAKIYKHHFSKKDWESIYSEFKSISNSRK